MNNNKIPRTPFSTRLSGKAGETERRLRRIVSGPGKRPPAVFLAAVFAACLLCGNLVSCQVERPAEAGSGSGLTDASQSGPDPAPVLALQDLAPDLNRNGVPEEIRLVVEHRPSGYIDKEVQFWEGEELIKRESPGVYLCTLEGKDYILRRHVEEHQDSFLYSYSVSDFSGEFEETYQWNDCSFDLNFAAPFHGEFIPEDIAAHVEELNALLAHSVLLSEKDGELVPEYPQPETLEWLDRFPEIFTRDPERTLLDNLKGFLWAMSQSVPFPVPQPVDRLPMDEPLNMCFSSGAGAWSTELTLNPDGSFTGLFVDSDMGSDGDGFPNGTRYVCQFHGRFGTFAQLTDASWSLALEELVLDDERPIGTEELLDGFRYIYSGPYGLDGEDGALLHPGAGFMLFAPEAAGDEPGTELYGAYDFWTWWPGRHGTDSAFPDALGCWGLLNLKTGYGFFTYGGT